MDIVSYLLSRKYTDNSIKGISGVLAGKNCTISSATKADGVTTVVFKWTADDGTSKTTEIQIDDGTPIYVWTSGNHYNYGDLAIYESCFYRCITPNSDTVFDDTKWNEIGSPDGNYDIVQRRALLPSRFTSADRKMYFSIEDECFFLWNGLRWVTEFNYVAGQGITIERSADGEGKVISVNSITQQELADMWNN